MQKYNIQQISQNNLMIPHKIISIIQMKGKVLIGGRYQYNPNQPQKQSSLYSEYRAYDKTTKRDLLMHKLQQQDPYIQKITQTKHPFIHSIHDTVRLQEQGKVAVFFQQGPLVTLEQAINKAHYLCENDALVIFKFCLLALRELHEKIIVYERMALENVIFCTHSLIKLGTNLYPSQIPLQNRAPEILKGEKGTYASDIFGVGVIMYRILYGCYPFQGTSEDSLLSSIKSKNFVELKTSSPFKIIIAKQLRVLVSAMLSYKPEDRPSLQDILAIPLLSFPVQTQLQSYTKPKTNIMPQPFLRKYLIFRSSKLLYRIDDYYQQNFYLGLNITNKQFVTIVIPDWKMFQCDPRKVQSYFQKLRAIKDSYMSQSCGFLCRVEDFQRFRREPVVALEYCNQGDLFHYLEKIKKQQNRTLSQKQINILMYLLAISYKQIRDIGVTSIHTVHSQRILIKNNNIKLREPGLLTPFIENKLYANVKRIDYFAPELKEKIDFVELDRSDMWSYGVLYYWLLSAKLPEVSQETNKINIDSLDTNRKNKNLIAKCLDQTVSKRLTLEQLKIEGINEQLLESMLQEKRRQQQADQLENQSNSEDGHIDGGMVVGGGGGKKKDNRVIFKNRKKSLFRNYNKIIAKSSTSGCRIAMKILAGLIILWVVFFGIFFVNGGVGMLRTNYYRKITLQVPYNYATSLYNFTLLSTNGTKFENQYKDYSYQQYTLDLRCTQNNHSSIAVGEVHDYINYGHSVQCFFGFVIAIFISVCYAVIQWKLDLPKVLVERKQKNSNDGIFHFVIMCFIVPAMLFCFFTVFVFQYLIQMTPCLGISSNSYPKFTSVQTLLNGNTGEFIKNIFPTVILWQILMILYIFLSLLHKKINNRIMEIKFIVGVGIVMGVYTLVCRIGFGSAVPIEPSWTYKINRDVTRQYWGLFGLFPEVLFVPMLCLDRVIDFVFWFFLRLGMEPSQQEDINQVEFNAKLDPVDPKELQGSKAKINMLQNEFQLFD